MTAVFSALSPFIRIALRLFAGYLVGKGVADEATANAIWQDEVVIGGVIALLNELWYAAAKWFGWSK